MSAIYIIPLQNTHSLIDANINFMETNNGTTIIEVTRDSNIPVKTQKLLEQQQQRFWLSSSPPTSTLDHEQNIHSDNTNMHNTNASMTASDFVESCTVTHSFANRKRSIVKRRKSVLSSSFTADDETKINESDSNIDLDVLETMVHHVEEEQELAKEIDQYSIVHKEDNHVEGIYLSYFENDDVSKRDLKTSDRGLRGGFESEQVPVDSTLEQKISDPKDSAIDLRTTLESTVAPISPSSSSSTSPPIPSSPQTSSIPIKNKKKSSWSPRKIFSTHKENDSTKKFTITSFFSRKSQKKAVYPSKANTSSSETLVHTFNPRRLPIHTERAIYRLSHIKLTNAKRPLRDQVIISNLMFWYLSIVNQPEPKARLPKRKIHPQNKVYQSPYSRTSSSSDEEDESDDEPPTSSDEDEPKRKEKKKKTKKYSLFYTKKNTSWLPSFSPKQHGVAYRDNEDDIPLAMYQRNKN